MSNVYFIRSGPLVKIGFADDVAARLVQLQTGNPYGLQLVAVLTEVTSKLERVYHKALAEHRVRGEWFRLAGPVLHLVRHIQSGARPLTAPAISYYASLHSGAKKGQPDAEFGRIHRDVRVAAREAGLSWPTLREHLMARGPLWKEAVEAYERRHPGLPLK